MLSWDFSETVIRNAEFNGSFVPTAMGWTPPHLSASMCQTEIVTFQLTTKRTLDKTILTAWIGTLLTFMGWHPNVSSVVNDNESNEAESYIESDKCTHRDELLRYAICL
jgi:hypothetical protein